MAFLRVIKGLHPGQLFPIEDQVTTIGRSPDCQLVIESGAVSRHHLRIARRGGRYYAEDLGSLNGSFVNDERIDGSELLRDGDQIGLCDIAFSYHEGNPQPASASSEAVVLDEGDGSESIVATSLGISSRAGETSFLQANADAKLHAIIEIGQRLASTIKLEDVLQRILESLFRVFSRADRGFIVLAAAGTDRLDVRAFRSRQDEDQAQEGIETQVRISRTMIRQAMESGRALLLTDSDEDSRFGAAESITNFHIRSAMCVPLVDSEGKPLGVIQLDTLDRLGRFTQNDLDVLAVVAGQLAMAIENAQLHETALRERALERELALAHRVQHALLPTESPKINGYEFYAYYEPAHLIGGDYYDYIALPDDRLAVVVADVSGKGVAAALMMAKLSAEMRFSLAMQASPVAAMRRINEIFSGERWRGRFVTCVIGLIDPRKHRVTVANAGHAMPLRLDADGAITEEAGIDSCFPLGWYATAEYNEFEIELAAGERLFLYSDGLTDAHNPAEESYGLSRLKQRLAGRTGGVEKVGRWLIDDIRMFIGSSTQPDDITLACFGRLDASAK